MAFQRPALTEIIQRVQADMSRFVGVAGAVLRRSVVGVIGRAIAGASHELHGRLDYIARQVIPDTAEDDQLQRWANVWGVQRKSAEYAGGQVTFTGVAGSTVPQGAILQRQDGALFATSADCHLALGSGTVAVLAMEAGAAGNTDSAVTLTLQQPVSGVQPSATVTAGGIDGGSDTESDDELRARLLDRIRQPPHGGAAFDYVRWAREVPGVTRAWVYPMEMGAGTVTVRFVRDNDDDMIPDTSEVTEVYSYIEARRPVTAELFVVAPVAVELDLTIQVNPNTSAVRDAITAELADMIRREAVPGGTILISHIREAVSIAAGEFDHVVVSPAANVTHTTGQIAVIGDITFGTIS